MTEIHLHDVNVILELFSREVFPVQMCPPLLLVEIIRINHLRTRAARHKENPCPRVLQQEAYGTLGRIQAFSPQRWGESKLEATHIWVLVGAIYQEAVALYCISSLQSLSVLPSTLSSPTHAQLLHLLLGEALSYLSVKRFMLWPLVILGVGAVTGGTATRAFVEKELTEMSYHVGSHAPLAAIIRLKMFWASGETSWDACFNRPYVFASQIAVDLSRFPP